MAQTTKSGMAASAANLPACQPVSSTSQVRTISGSSAQSAAITGTLVRVCSDVPCFIDFGTNPTAVADGTDMFLPALTPEYFVINSGDKVAAIQISSAGNLYITPMTDVA